MNEACNHHAFKPYGTLLTTVIPYPTENIPIMFSAYCENCNKHVVRYYLTQEEVEARINLGLFEIEESQHV